MCVTNNLKLELDNLFFFPNTNKSKIGQAYAASVRQREKIRCEGMISETRIGK